MNYMAVGKALGNIDIPPGKTILMLHTPAALKATRKEFKDLGIVSMQAQI